MALIDWEAVVHDVQAYVRGLPPYERPRDKTSFGQRELTDFIADAVVRHRQVEGLPEKALRLYGSELEEVLSRSTHADDPAGVNGNGGTLTPSQ